MPLPSMHHLQERFSLDSSYFSDRELGPRPRVEEDLPPSAWGGIFASIETRLSDHSFGYNFPLLCPDQERQVPYGCDKETFWLALQGEIPALDWPLDPRNVPPLPHVFDLIEFCFRHVARAVPFYHHGFYGHDHLRFDPEQGRTEFRTTINSVLARNGVAYELDEQGRVVRLPYKVLGQALKSAEFNTGDTELDSLLESARAKYLDPDYMVRRDSLEKLWDAWKRLKTIEPGQDKKNSVAALLDRAAPEPAFRDALDKEARELTRIGNVFRIRHSETTQVPLEFNEHIDYLFHRLFALIRSALLLTASHATPRQHAEWHAPVARFAPHTFEDRESLRTCSRPRMAG